MGSENCVERLGVFESTTRLTRDELCRYLATAPPRILLMVEVVVVAATSITACPMGHVELHFSDEQVSGFLRTGLGRFKIDHERRAPRFAPPP